MKRRDLLLGIGATVGAGAAISTGAFSNASVDRQVSVTVADDAAGLLSLAPASGPNGSYVDDSGDRVAVALGDSGAGLTEGAQYEFDATLHVGNQGTQPVYVWTEVGSAAFGDDQLYAYRGDPDTPLNAANAAEVGVGTGFDLGFFVDTSGVDTDTYNPTITVHASDTPPEGESPGDDPGEPTDLVDELVFDSTASLLAAGDGGDDFGYLDQSQIVVSAMDTAESTDADGNGDAISYPDGEPLPLVAVDDPVVAFGFPFAQNDVDFQYGNEEVLLNVLDEYAGSGTVLWDESHGQFYDLDTHSSFADYAEDNGYDVSATDDLEADIGTADAVVVTSPADAFSSSELDALSSFADGGGLVVLMDQSDFDNFDATDNFNDIAGGIGTEIRFNDNQVVDDQNNDGIDFVPTTSNFNEDDYASLLAQRQGLDLNLSRDETYEVDVVSVADGDTADVAFPDQGGLEATVRIVGVDTPETGGTEERIEEYEGITDESALKDRADEASTYADDLLAGETVTLSFDENEPLRGNYGRLLGFLELPNGDVYNRRVVEDGWARVYSSGFHQHDDYWDAEDGAQAAGDGIWTLSDPAAVPESGDDPVSSLFFPNPVEVSGGTTVVSSEAGDALVALDDANGVAAVGGPLVDEAYEPDEAEGDDPPTNDGQQVYPFLTNVIDRLADGGIDGPVLFDGGHGQFNSGFALSAEDVAHYQRYLEGQSTDAVDSIALEGTNDLTDDEGPALLDGSGNPAASALVVTTPVDAFTSAERSAVADFAAAGGAVVLVGSAADGADVSNFDDLVSDLGTAVGFTTTAVTDGTNNIGDPSLPTTTNFASGASDLFTAFTPGSGSGGLVVDELVYDPADSSDNEYVTFRNEGSTALDLDGYTVHDEGQNYEYTFSDVDVDVTLEPDETITLHCGSGTDTDTDVYWGETYVWNNTGDTVFVDDADGNTVVEYPYSG